MVLADPEMTGQIKETIRAKQVNAEAALTEVTDMFIAIFEGMEDNPYMQERAADIRDVTKRVCANLAVRNCLTQQQSMKNQSRCCS